MQRLTQMAVVPDVLPDLDPIADVQLGFRRRVVQPGEFVDSRVSELPARLQIQLFEKGEDMVTIAVVDPDVPDPENDSFSYRCHFLAANIPVSPTSTSVALSKLSADSQTVLSWLPPHAQKGSPYHRLAVVVLRQPERKQLDIPSLKESITREGFRLRGFVTKHSLRLIGAHLFRTQWDEGTAGVMARAGLLGADIEFRRKRVEPLKKKQLPLKKKKNLVGLAGLPSKRL